MPTGTKPENCLNCGSAELVSCTNARIDVWFSESAPGRYFGPYGPVGTFYLCSSCGRTEIYAENVADLAKVMTDAQRKQGQYEERQREKQLRKRH
jgi:predicted nucleic-acid-binding Zn-ribbon protein